MQTKFSAPIAAAVVILVAISLAGCGTENLCANPEVLNTVKKLYAQRTLGQFIEAPEGAFTAQDRSATPVSVDNQSKIAKCSVLIRADALVLAKMVQRSTDEELAQMKENAAKRGVPTFEDFLVNYQVQPLASGQNYVTLLR
ncbi:hypothetical protein [Bradyrhizobium sp. HKCCYLS3013]|uniref:hypothetical protein n=1 Tax=Bradyrhizobium sp. HKCCYLS3013 TaxID=3420735 RepID=UPI003EB92A7C